MTKKQTSILISYLRDKDVDIQAVQYPFKFTFADGRTLPDVLMIHYQYTLIGTDDTRGYVDWYDGHGDRKKTEFKGRVNETSNQG